MPARLRPFGWPATISLPAARPYCTGPTDRKAIARIVVEAAALYNKLTSEKSEDTKTAEHKRGSVPWLLEQWGGPRLLAAVEGKLETMAVALEPGEDGADDWLHIEASTRAGYIRLCRHILGWSEMNQHRPIRGITPASVGAFLDKWKDKRIQRRNIRALLVHLFEIARKTGTFAGENPAKAITFQKRKRQKGGRKTTVQTWARSVVDGYAEIARTTDAFRNGRGSREAGPWAGGSRLIQLMYQTSADSTDVITWKKGKGGHFVDDPILPGINYDRGKTGEAAGFVPISRALADEIRSSPGVYLVTHPFDTRPYRPTVDDAKLRSHWKTLRRYAVAAGQPYMVLDHLRHTAVTEAVEAGVDIEDTKHLSVHKDSAMNRKVYAQRRTSKTEEIQRARGLIE